MSCQVKIRPVVESDEPGIKKLYFSDVYHWSAWVKPILFDGIVGLMAKPIAGVVVGICICCFWDSLLAACALSVLVLFVLILFSAKLLLFLRYNWSSLEYPLSGLTQFHSRKGFAFFVAEVHGVIVGCVGVQTEKKQVAEIHRMAVSWRCQGLGIGKRLLGVALDFAKAEGFREIVLGTSHKQQRAKRFYEKNGFRSTKSFFVFHYGVPFFIYRFRYYGEDETEATVEG